MEKRIKKCHTLHGEVVPPGDKSISHRAIIFNSMAAGEARVSNVSPGDDCLSTIACMRALGVEISPLAPSVIKVKGVGKQGFREAEDVLDAGNSGTTMRLLTGLLAAQPFLSILTGDESLRSRPMDRFIVPLRLMGAEIWGRKGDSVAPLAIRGGRLKGIEYRLPVASAQLKSALLIAALFAQGSTTVEEPAPSRDHTERLLQSMGAHLEKEGCKVTLFPNPAPLTPTDVNVPGDISSAAFWLVAGAVHPNASIRVLNIGVNETRIGILEVLQAMGARLEVENERSEGGEPVADIRIESGPLVATCIEGEIIPRLIDEIPVIAVAACLAKGTTVIRDAAELRVKESDRISATVQELSKLGARMEELPDGMVIHGVERLRGARCDSHQDHRLAMTLAMAGLVAEGETIIEHADVVGVSYPGFWQDLEALSAQ